MPTVLYWCRCGNCGTTAVNFDLAALVHAMYEHWRETHPGTIHIPEAGRLEIP